MEPALGDARDVLDSAREWHLSTGAWEDAATLVDELAAAVADRAPMAIRAATAELELAGPLRVVTSIEDPPQGPAPPPVRDRINEVTASQLLDLLNQVSKSVDDLTDRMAVVERKLADCPGLPSWRRVHPRTKVRTTARTRPVAKLWAFATLPFRRLHTSTVTGSRSRRD